MSKWRALRLSRLAKARAAYGLGGGIPAYSRHELDLGFYVERGNLVGDAKRKPYKWRPRRGESSDAPERGGPSCSSEETAVMAVEQRGWANSASHRANLRGGAGWSWRHPGPATAPGKGSHEPYKPRGLRTECVGRPEVGSPWPTWRI